MIQHRTKPDHYIPIEIHNIRSEISHFFLNNQSNISAYSKCEFYRRSLKFDQFLILEPQEHLG
jgi:hypothetical protein